MDVSVVIPNNGRDISATRRELERLSDVEVIEIDLGMERSDQRNIGISQAKGKYIFILDSDQYPTKELVIQCIDMMEISDCQGIYIPEIIVGKDWFTRLRNFERQFYTGTAIDCVRFVRSNNCPPFDSELSGPEDADWDLRIKGPKLISKNPLYHFDNITLKEYIAKKTYYTKSMHKFEEKHPDAKVLELKYRCWSVFVEDGKWKKLLRHPIATLMLMGLLFIRGVIYIKQ